jgi:phospholipid/cholesterol/gamma-HCH transport system substrate-binding protein
MSGATVARIAALAALALVAIAAAAIVNGGGNPYQVRAVFADTGGLVTGFRVRIDGAPVGTVSSLRLDHQDHVVATLDLDRSAAPVGRNATVTVRAADLLGEKFVDLQPGNRQDPAPSGTEIPISRTGLAVELDDVLNSLDLTTRGALRAFLDETGTAFAGRGGDLASLLAVLPPSLDQTRQLLAQLGQNNGALGNLVSESDRVVASVTAQRATLGHLVGSASDTLNTLASKRAQLASTVADAPATLTALRRALAALERAAIPLGPAATGLAQTAPPLTATLRELPSVTAAAKPTLATIRQISPTLITLATRGTPVVRRLKPLTSQLATFSSSLSPVTSTLDRGAADVLGLMEGWSRSTQGRDAAGHVFRFGLTVSPATFGSLAALFASHDRAKPRAVRRAAPHPAPAAPPNLAALLAPVTRAAQPVTGVLNGLKQVAAPLTQSVQKLTSTVTQALQKLGLGAGTGGGGAGAPPTQSPDALKQLLSYLLR